VRRRPRSSSGRLTRVRRTRATGSFQDFTWEGILMLVLSRKVGQKIFVGEDVVITIVRVKGDRSVGVGVDAPSKTKVLREEIKGKQKRTPAA
jgi:carbon storage regulator CsrA